MMKAEAFIRQAEGLAAVSDEEPGAEFLDYYEQSREKIGTIILGLKKDDRPTGEFTIRVGMMPPQSAVIDERIMDFCRQPTRRLFALEACGFWINRLCREAAEFPVLASAPRDVRWIRNWGLPTQDTQSVRFVTGILLEG